MRKPHVAPESRTAPSEYLRLPSWIRRFATVVTSLALAGVCLIGTTGTASAAEPTKLGGYYSVSDAERITRSLITASTIAGVGCGMHNLAKALQKNRAVGKTYLGAIAQKSAQVSSKVANSKGFCKSAAQLLAAGTLIAVYANRSGGVYVMETTATDVGVISKTVKTTYDVGPGPSSEGTTSFTTSTKMSRW